MFSFAINAFHPRIVTGLRCISLTPCSKSSKPARSLLAAASGERRARGFRARGDCIRRHEFSMPRRPVVGSRFFRRRCNDLTLQRITTVKLMLRCNPIPHSIFLRSNTGGKPTRTERPGSRDMIDDTEVWALCLCLSLREILHGEVTGLTSPFSERLWKGADDKVFKTIPKRPKAFLIAELP